MTWTLTIDIPNSAWMTANTPLRGKIEASPNGGGTPQGPDPQPIETRRG